MTKPINPDDVCPRPEPAPPMPAPPLTPAIHTSAVYRCSSPEQADQLLSGELAGYVYARDGHPNADLLSEKCRLLHGADRAVVCSSGMGALAAALLSQLSQGDHVLVSSQLYGRSLQLFTQEAARLGISSTVVDACNLKATAKAVEPHTRLVVMETITNPGLRVPDLAGLAEIAQRSPARLLVDNTFASPIVCRPVEWGADLVQESLTKIISGHSDVVLGLLCGAESTWQRVPQVLSTWGLASSPFDCWLAYRGLGTLALRVQRASANALAVAQFLRGRNLVKAVRYPGLEEHPDHQLARRQFGEQFGSVVTFDLPGGMPAAETFIAAASKIPFSPSLGDLSTTLSHPASTSHRGLSAAERAALGITGGTIRLSVGIESPEGILEALEEGLAAAR